ncbi:MAG: hypothetical protein HRU20_08935 [Pseudomonadales bacterium]|nr:hypothetical protein [Pseudomonadales bacterium]
MIRDKEELTKSLEDAKFWCTPLIDIKNPQSCFRTPLLEKYIAKSEGSDFDSMSFWPEPEVIDQTLSIRKDALENISVKNTNSNLGRLLLCIPDWSNHNGL